MRQAAGITGRLAGSLAVLGLFVFVGFQVQPGADAADLVVLAAETPAPVAEPIEPVVPALDGFEWSVEDSGWTEVAVPSVASPTVMGSDGYLWSTGGDRGTDLAFATGDGD